MFVCQTPMLFHALNCLGWMCCRVLDKLSTARDLPYTLQDVYCPKLRVFYGQCWVYANPKW